MPHARREDAVTLTFQRDGHIGLGDERFMVTQLPVTIRNRVNRGAERKVYLTVDKYSKYGTVLEVLEAIRNSGVDRIAFITW